MVTSDTVFFDKEGFFAVMTSATIFARIQITHRYLDIPLLHLGKNVRVVAVITGQAGIFVGGSIE
jgi:hypothetical protein